MRPNVLLIILDTARADALEPYGAPADSSPAAADLAQRGVVAPEARATACWTLPSHLSIFTGALPRGLGLGQSLTPHAAAPTVRAQRERMLPEVLRRAGYKTAAVSTNMWVSPYSGFEVGFDNFVQVDGARQNLLDRGRRQRAKWMLESARGTGDDGAREARRVIESWIGPSVERPFFWFVNLLECHSPYLPPRPYHSVSVVERLRAAEEARRYLTLKEIWRACVTDFEVPDDALDRMRRLYAGSVRYADAWIEAILSRLDESGLLDETLVVVTSDHGENFGEGGLMAHALSLDERLVRVPLVASGPGAEALADLRSLAELPARIARAVGVSEHPWSDGGLPAGMAVGQFDPPADTPRIRELVAEWELGDRAEEAFQRSTTPITYAAQSPWKLVRRGAVEELYDLETDPLELDPISDPTRMRELAGKAVGDLRAALDHPAVIASARQPGPSDAESDEIAEIEDRMRLLGYM